MKRTTGTNTSELLVNLDFRAPVLQIEWDKLQTATNTPNRANQKHTNSVIYD